ncbi:MULTISPECIES: tetratricopeptide repeat protein [unclassified Empedobacter]|uniref:tetratricopeptide repeat protein n=1 Tax=unclassified Empedobacter TaxID=2643773 RepID=UPI0025C5253B|nr:MULTISPECIES: tetratricopeptide repeat protein [unclassified Empedobacter]
MTRIEYLVAHPYEVEKSDIPLLKKEVEKYPYFYTLRALLLYGLKKENHPSFEDYLNKTSIHSSNRVDLYHYINSETIQKEIQTKTETISPEMVEEKVEELAENKIISEPILENSTSEIIENNNETIEVIDEIIEEELNQEIEVISETNSEEINGDIVDGMIENDTEESELRTDHVVDIISDEELNEVAKITNKVVVENNSKEENLTSENDIENAVQQTSGIEIIESEPQQVIETIEDNQEEEIIEGLSENAEVIEESEPETIEEKVEIIENNSDDSTFSFSDWLKKVPSQSKTQQEIEEEQETAEKEIKYKLIDDFLEKNPKIVPMKKTDITPVSTPSNFVQNTEEYSDLMTETLAQIYTEQKKYDKAIKAYKILILKYPEKNSLFANRIKEIENLKNSK